MNAAFLIRNLSSKPSTPIAAGASASAVPAVSPQPAAVAAAAPAASYAASSRTAAPGGGREEVRDAHPKRCAYCTKLCAIFLT